MIEQEIDFTDPHGIKLSKQNDGFTHIVDKTVPIIEPTQTREIHFDSADYSNSKPSLNNANQVQILNILNTDNIDSLLSEDSFLELLNESFALNILIQRGSFLPSQSRYLRHVTCCEFKTIGKNLLLEINNHEINRYQMILDKDRSFVNLHPIL